MNKLDEIFETEKPIIGVVHLSPLLGYKKFEGVGKTLERAIADSRAFEKGGVSGIIIENNYDLPHKIKVGPETVAIMTYLTNKISTRINLPIGISVLWNDYKAALAISKLTSAEFIRVPVFVDKVKTKFGKAIGNPEEVIEYRNKIDAEDVALFTDIQVKHAELLEEKPIDLSAKQAIESGSDALIVTGEWTGKAPATNKLKKVRNAVGGFPILIGSGANKENINELLRFADGAIVSTSLKAGASLKAKEERNIKPFQNRIDSKKVNEFMNKLTNERDHSSTVEQSAPTREEPTGPGSNPGDPSRR